MDNLFGKINIGTSGYAYHHWRDVFYPSGLQQSNYLEYYSRFFGIVELNVTFYNLPSRDVFQKWHDETPTGFRFAVKGPRLITHYKKLNDVTEIINTFYERISPLGKKLEVVLWQLPPGFELDIDRFERFIEILRKLPRARYAFEFRNESWFENGVYELLASLNAAIVLSDWPFNVVSESQGEINEIMKNKKFEVPDTANFYYLRRHGSKLLYSSSYSKEELGKDADSILAWSKTGSDIYEFFNNDAGGNAVKNAMALQTILIGDQE